MVPIRTERQTCVCTLKNTCSDDCSQVKHMINAEPEESESNRTRAYRSITHLLTLYALRHDL